MQRAIRVQGNAVEDVPVVLLGLLGLAALAAPVVLIHALGGSFLVGGIYDQSVTIIQSVNHQVI